MVARPRLEPQGVSFEAQTASESERLPGSREPQEDS